MPTIGEVVPGAVFGRALLIAASALIMLSGCGGARPLPVGEMSTSARTPSGEFISWREHIIDDSFRAGFPLSGGDGLVMADLDNDGHDDIVSVHESDVAYDGEPDGHVRIAFGSDDPDDWLLATLASGPEAGAPEDAAIGDVNGDGYLDVVVASELAHLIYFQNPGRHVRAAARWPRVIIPQTENRGSYIRVFLGDFDRDGRLELVAPNKGAQNPRRDRQEATSISIYHHGGNPLSPSDWGEYPLGAFLVPQNAHTVDIDADGDIDIIGGVRYERRLVMFENRGGTSFKFREQEVRIDEGFMAGFNLAIADVNDDGRLDIIGASSRGLAWLEQPPSLDGVWRLHPIGTFQPDTMTGMAAADIDGDGRVDVIAGSYSRGPRDHDGEVDALDRLGRIGWFQQPDDLAAPWVRHDISRRKRGMFDQFVPRDLDGDGDVDFVGTRGNSNPFDGVFWLEQVRRPEAGRRFIPARSNDSREMPLPTK